MPISTSFVLLSCLLQTDHAQSPCKEPVLWAFYRQWSRFALLNSGFNFSFFSSKKLLMFRGNFLGLEAVCACGPFLEFGFYTNTYCTITFVCLFFRKIRCVLRRVCSLIKYVLCIQILQGKLSSVLFSQAVNFATKWFCPCFVEHSWEAACNYASFFIVWFWTQTRLYISVCFVTRFCVSLRELRFFFLFYWFLDSLKVNRLVSRNTRAFSSILENNYKIRIKI